MSGGAGNLPGAIGIFDSGIGGLSVALAVRKVMPAEHLIYVADTAYAPYGDKTDDFIYQRMALITQQLIQAGVKAVVVACNTATTAAISKLRENFALPIIGVEPGVKPAVLASKSKVVGILATPRTLLTPAFASLTQRYADTATILLQPCPVFVPLIEALQFDSPQMRDTIQHYIQPLLQQGADTLVLGCTHYNFIADVIADVAGPGTTMVRTEIAVAKQLQQRLAQAQLLNSSVEVGADNFYTSGDLGLFNRQLLRLWPADATAFPL
ncbi:MULTISPECIES: glutamate racemase [Rheinheimera]|jgi:glutamate racemase|uniref:glutamate racemase n=1 Tax=Rheinheimera TaxID=67575 RepID=UPI000E7EFA12|nr:glutamate racemase [Rheinheimera aquimaris]MCD1599257.1 glutamate racemase [Rheinheimera aquimaris]HBN88959.1 glutamate racemase [Rheinheimera sp.]